MVFFRILSPFNINSNDESILELKIDQNDVMPFSVHPSPSTSGRDLGAMRSIKRVKTTTKGFMLDINLVYFLWAHFAPKLPEMHL